MNSRSLLSSVLFVSLSLSLSACAGDDLLVDDGDVASADEAVRHTRVLENTSFEDLDIDPSVKPESLVFTTQSAYRKHFGHDAIGVDFPNEWVVYYSAGLQTSDGHTAKIRRVKLVGDRLEVVTSLASPGAACEAHAIPEVPFVLVKIAAPASRPQQVSFKKQDSLTDCSSPTTPSTPNAVAADCAARRGGAMITFEVANTASERVTAWVTDGEFVDEAKRLQAANEQRIPNFKLVDGTDCDARWSFHTDAVDIGWADFATEVCDAIPSQLDPNKAEWLAKNLRWCPWSARVISVDDRR